MTVKEFYNLHKSGKKGLWLCPNVCTNMSIAPRLYEEGLDFAYIGNVPTELLTKEVVKGFVEDDILCIIWKNH